MESRDAMSGVKVSQTLGWNKRDRREKSSLVLKDLQGIEKSSVSALSL
jgi:hypothetical protein